MGVTPTMDDRGRCEQTAHALNQFSIALKHGTASLTRRGLLAGFCGHCGFSCRTDYNSLVYYVEYTGLDGRIDCNAGIAIINEVFDLTNEGVGVLSSGAFHCAKKYKTSGLGAAGYARAIKIPYVDPATTARDATKPPEIWGLC